jgi:hypothetical protein
MQLHHVSDRGDIERFEPRAIAGGDRRELVWAVDQSHLVNYLLPRDCPRVCFRADLASTEADRVRFLGIAGGPVVAIEVTWLERASSSRLWVYQLPVDSFECEDKNAGYFVSRHAVSPIARRTLEGPLVEMVNAGAELRVVASLRGLAADVARSTLSFSCIRMRNAAGLRPQLEKIE